MTKTVSFHGHEAESLRMFNEKISVWQQAVPVNYNFMGSITNFSRFCIFRHQFRFYEDTKEETIKTFAMELLLHFDARCAYNSSYLAITLFFDFLECDRAGNLKKEGFSLRTRENIDLKDRMNKLVTTLIVYPQEIKADQELLRKDLFATLSLWKVLNKKPKFNTDSFITKFLETLNAE